MAAAKDTAGLPPPPPPRIRWAGNVGCAPYAEWVEDADDLIPRIRAVLARVLPSVISSHLELAEVEFMAEGTWNRTYTVRLRPRAAASTTPRQMSSPSPSSSSSIPARDNTQEPIANLPSTPPSPPSPSSSSSSAYSATSSSRQRPSTIPLTPESSLRQSPNTPVSQRTLGKRLRSYALTREPSFLARDITATELIMRVALPAYPTNKTESEVATLQWVRQHTSIPVPRVYAYDSFGQSANDPLDLGYEWMLMERMLGEKYAVVEDTMSSDARIALATTLASWVDSLSRFPFTQIGSLYHSPPQSPDSKCTPDGASDKKEVDDGTHPALGPLVFQPFFGDWCLEYDFNRGPFDTLHEFALECSAAYKHELSDQRQIHRAKMAHLGWLIDLDDLETTVSDSYYSDRERREAQQQMDTESEAERLARHSRIHKHRDDLEAARRRVPSVSAVSFDHFRLDLDELPALHKSAAILDEIIHVIKPHSTIPSPTFLVHWDISEDNVLVDAEGRPTALLDWEQVIALPLSVVSYYPRLLQAGWSDEVDDRFDDSVEGQMRRAFDRRLRELESPWLDTLDADMEDDDDDEEEEEEKEEDSGEEEDEEENRQTEDVSGAEGLAAAHPCDDKTALAPILPSRSVLHPLFSELQHSLHSARGLEDMLQQVKAELEDGS